ncbi:MAG: hypothetical protein JO206_09050 [Solirubrobacterales bacterium]|nr:hypothetical protein [Solirubrobacterales bacterium]MBV9473105.1 hypothetical protein [Solirubrobacterales bacterium]
MNLVSGGRALRRLAAALAVTIVLPAGLAGADSFTPVRLELKVAPVARLRVPLATAVAVSADAGALDIATAPLRMRVKLAPECGATFATTPGPVLLDKPLAPQPATGKAYAATVRGSGRPTAYGIQTVCAFLEEQGDERMFANDTTNVVDVSVSCTVAAARYDGARAALSRAQRQLRRARSRGARARLKRLVARRRRALNGDRRPALRACGPGVPL